MGRRRSDHGFASRDGRCLIGFRQEALWRRFAVAIGRVDLLDNPEFLRAVGIHPPLFAPLVEGTLRGWTMTALDRLVRGELGGTLVPVLDLRRMIDHEQTRCLGIIDRSRGFHLRFPLDASAHLLRETVHA